MTKLSCCLTLQLFRTVLSVMLMDRSELPGNEGTTEEIMNSSAVLVSNFVLALVGVGRSSDKTRLPTSQLRHAAEDDFDKEVSQCTKHDANCRQLADSIRGSADADRILREGEECPSRTAGPLEIVGGRGLSSGRSRSELPPPTVIARKTEQLAEQSLDCGAALLLSRVQSPSCVSRLRSRHLASSASCRSSELRELRHVD